MNKGEYPQALKLWPSSFGKSRFSRTADGVAMYSIVLYKNALEVSATHKLFSIAQPQKISPRLREILTNTIPRDHAGFSFVTSRTAKKWSLVFPHLKGWGAQSLSGHFFLPTARDVRQFEKKIQSTQLNSSQKAWLHWQLALAKTLINQEAEAHWHLNHAQDLDPTIIDFDLLHMTQARGYYQSGQLQKAIYEYDKVKKSSDYWLESLEEKAWAYLRLDEPDKTLAQLKTVLAPVFTPQVGAEPYFLQSFAQLKICNYAGASQTLGEFKSLLRDRIASLQDLANTGKNRSWDKFSSIFSNVDLKWENLGSDVHYLPRNFHRDLYLKEYLARYRGLQTEKHILTTKFNQNNEFAGEIADIYELSSQSIKKAQNRLSFLAKQELNDVSKIIQKMHIVEAEIIQQIHLSEKNVSVKPAKQPLVKSADKLQFPVTTEVWMDELDNYEVNINNCPWKKGQVL